MECLACTACRGLLALEGIQLAMAGELWTTALVTHSLVA